MEASVHSFLGVLLPQQGQRADGLQDVVFHPVGRQRVMNGRTGDDRKAMRTRLLRRHLVEPAGKQLRKARIGTDRNQPFRKRLQHFSRGRLPLLRRYCAFLGGRASPRALILADGLGSLGSRGRSPSHFRLLREQPVQVVIAAGGFDVEQQGVVVHPQFRSEDRLDARVFRRLGELYRAVQIADVGQGNGRNPVLLGAVCDGRGRKRGIEKGVVTANAQGNVGRRSGWGDSGSSAVHTDPEPGLRVLVREVPGRVAQSQIVSAQNHGPAFIAPQFIQHHGQPFAGFMVLRGRFQGQFAAEHAVIHVRQFQRHHPQAHAPLPRLAQQSPQSPIDIRLQIRRFAQAFGSLVFVTVVVTHLHCQRPHAPAFLAHGRKQSVGHAPQHGFHVFFVGHVFIERFLLAEGLLRLARGNQRTLINAVGELSQDGGLAAEQQREQIDGRRGDLPDVGQSRCIQAHGGLWPDARQPLVREGMQKLLLLSARHVLEGGGLVQLGGNLTDQLVGGDAFADADLERLADRLADRQRDLEGGFLVVGRQVEIALVNRSLLHVRREIVGVAEHPVGELLVAFVIARQDDKPGAKLSRPRRRHWRVDAELPGLIRS